jgi:non-homologous end joining protein Ku
MIRTSNTGEEVSNDDIMKGYKIDTDTYIEVSKEELENIALESTRTCARPLDAVKALQRAAAR